MEIDICVDNPNKFLIDTGADISIIKKQFIKGQTVCFPNRKCKIKGITHQIITTKAECLAKIRLSPNVTINHIIHIVDDNFPIEQTGILGSDFLDKHKCTLDYSKELLIIPHIQGDQRLKLSSENNQIIPARTEKVITIPTNIDTDSDCIVFAKEIQPGVRISNSIVKPTNKLIALSVINSNEYPIKINQGNFDLHKIEHFDIFQMNTWNNIIEDRINTLVTQIKLENMNKEERTSIIGLCKEFNDIFHIPGDVLTATDAITHKIHMIPNSSPKNVKQYRLPHALRAEVDRQVEEMLKNQIIEHSNSPFNSPLLVVPKKSTSEKKWRIVIDFRKLNDQTINDVYPLPNISEILDQLGKANYFSTIDLADGYYQVKIDESDRQKTAFSTSQGHFQYVRMPMGLKGAPATFQRLMNNVLMGLTGIKCFCYLDDIVIYGYNLEEHNSRLRDVFNKLRKNNLKININKCQFLQKQIQYLGHIISDEGIKPDTSKIHAVRDYPVPQDATEVRRFLGLAGYYRKFILNFAGIVSPLLELLKKNTPFVWNAIRDDAFKKLKNCLITSPILQYPDFQKPFYLTCDASDIAIGAILSQIQSNGADLPIAYASRALNSCESNYSPIEKEVLAIIWGVEYFRPYLYGRSFHIVTDHRPLVYLFNVKDPKSKLIRWRIRLMEYQYTIKYKPGVLNTNADALSRVVNPNVQVPEGEMIVITRAKSKQLADEILQTNNSRSDNLTGDKTDNTNQDIDFNRSNVSNVNQGQASGDHQSISKLEDRHNIKEIHDEEEINRLILEFHVNPIGGHQGFRRTYNRIRSYFYFPKMMTRIRNFIMKCSYCQKNKYSLPIKMPLQITTTAKHPFEKIFLDIVGPFPASYTNKRYILTLQDDLSKFSLAFALEAHDAGTVAKTLMTNYICIFGTPQIIVTDQGTNFISALFQNMCKLLKIKRLTSTAYHPQTIGALERWHRPLAEYLRNYIDKDPLNWDAWIPYAMFVYNSTPHSTHGFMPFELVFGSKPNLPLSISQNVEPVYAYDDYVVDIKHKLQTSHEFAREKLIKSKHKSKLYYDRYIRPIKFNIGDKVLLIDEAKNGKLSQIYQGPYIVIDIIDEVNSKIQIRNSSKIVHNNRLKLYHE